MQSPKKKDHSKPKKAEFTQQEFERMKDLAARAQADLQNAKERMEKEARAIRTYAQESMLFKLLPTVSNFQRAFTHLPEDLKDHDWVKGLQAMEQAFIKELNDVGLKKIESLGQPVNPELHEVLQTGSGEKDIVINVVEEGYLLHDKILRPAKVIVGDGTQ